MSADAITGFISVVLRILLIQNPKKTAVGFLGGTVASFLIEGWGLVFKELSFEFLPAWKLSIVGVFLVHVPSLFRSTDLPDDVEKQFRVIRAACAAGNISKVQRRLMYQSVASNYIAQSSIAKSAVAATVDRPSA